MQIKGSLLLLLGVSIQWVFAAPLEAQLKGRDDPIALPSAITSTSPSISSSAKDPDRSNESFTSTSSSSMLTSTASASSISGAATSVSVTDSNYNSTIPPGQLPLQPEITPGFAIAGVLLIATGALYTLIGIKNKWLHVFLSAGYLVSVAITVLIIYVMDPPVGNAVQGAYLVAVVLPGLVVGGCSLIFTEMTEGLGCLLGGFSFSMWLLVLKAGGLITSTSGKSIFIAALSIAGFALSFSHYTRTYGLIVCISFSGSTALILGIDCFSRAGLKEFWAYLWNLNQNLFPLGATTYPVTKGIRVEIAAIFVIFLAGLVSQSKIHKIIQDGRAQRMTEREENVRAIEEEEMNVARRIEDLNIAEKERWEKIYGDKLKSGDESTRDSGVGDMESSKRGPPSTITSIRELDGKEIELSDMSSSTRSNGTGLIMSNETGQDGRVTIRVARDIEPEVEQLESVDSCPSRQVIQGSGRSQTITSSVEEETWGSGADEAHQTNPFSQQPSKMKTVTPEVIPLPFKIPEKEVEDDCSSVATFADEEPAVNSKGIRRVSSGGSGLLNKLSVRSKRLSQRYSKEQGISAEDLVIPYANDDDRASSIAATVDDLSEDEDMEKRSTRSSFAGRDPPLPATEFFAEKSQENKPNVVSSTQVAAEPQESSTGETVSSSPMNLASGDTHNKMSSGPSNMNQNSELRPESEFTVATDLPNNSRSEEFSKVPIAQPRSLTPSQDSAVNTTACATGGMDEDKDNKTESVFKVEASVTSAVDIKITTLTKDRLPSQLSRVVMSYRTNEWAKHLSHADSPQLDEQNISEDVTENQKTESAVPVDVEALQQTAHGALPLPVTRSSSQSSNQTPGLTRSSSTQSNITPFVAIAEGSPVHGQGVLTRNSSLQSLGGHSIHCALRNNSNLNTPEQIIESPRREITPSPRHFSRSISPFSSSNTLMGKRDTMIRNRSSYFSTMNPSSRTMAPTSEPYQFSPSQFHSSTTSQMGSETGSIRGSWYNHHVNPSSQIIIEDGDEIPLSHRRELIRQSTQQALIQPATNFNPHQPRRQSGAKNALVREQQLATWRASVTHDLQVQKQRKMGGVERQRSILWQERQAEEMRRATEKRGKEERDERRDERMRANGAGMEELHRRMLSRMQDEARRNDLSL